MKVLLTGATGFIGSHSAETIVAAGHRLRVLVRSRDRAERVLAARGLTDFEVAEGDMTDRAAVERAVAGCEAVVHTAATMYGHSDAANANVTGFTHIAASAMDHGLDPIVYTSTISAMFPPPGDRMTVDDPVQSLATDYGRSKSECERRARALQADGVPLVIVYPAGVWGPDDPAFGEGSKGIRDGLRFGFPVTSGGVSAIDVRDLATILARCLECGRGPRRYMAGGNFTDWPGLVDVCDEVTGRRVRRIRMAPPVVRGFGRIVDFLKSISSFDYPVTHEAAEMMTRFVPCDSDATIRELGVAFRPLRDTLHDMISWLHQEGHIKTRIAGRAASRQSR